MKHASKILVLITAVIMTACRIDASEPSDGMAAEISVAPGIHTLVVGDTITYKAIAIDKHGAVLSNRYWEWGSSNEAIARVSAHGIVTAIAPGGATILATTDDRLGGARITVLPR
jgi:uncharacterized protein YjdB